MSANIILHRSQDSFARVSKKLLNDSTISFKAKGILAYLLGKPENWKLRVSDLENHAKEGERSIRAALNELRAAGYAKYEQPKQKGVFCEGVWKISDFPIFSPRCGFANAENPHAENSHVSKNECSKNDGSLKKSKEDTVCNSARGSVKNQKPEYDPKWKPDTADKEEKLRRVKPPQDFPSEQEFDEFITSESNICTYRPGLYMELCVNKWHQWKPKYLKWIPIGDWKAYVQALEDRMEEAKEGATY